MKIIIATHKSWNIENAKAFKEKCSGVFDIYIVSKKEELTEECVSDISPDYIFFPHWSYIIPKEIFDNYNCVVFHMTDLPYGRGGSPLQNLIVRGIKETKISAIKVVKELDAGPVYLKEPLSLAGNAEEIFRRASDIIFDKMIPFILENEPDPIPQEGRVEVFKRRTPKDSEVMEDMSMESIYDYIRMLDAEGYPRAYINYGQYKLEFSKADFSSDQIDAKVTIRRK